MGCGQGASSRKNERTQLEAHLDNESRDAETHIRTSVLHCYDEASPSMVQGSSLVVPACSKAEAVVSGIVLDPAPLSSVPTSHVAVDDMTVLLGYESDHGLQWDAQWNGNPAGPRNEAHRIKVRNATKRKVIEMLGLKKFGEPAFKACKLPPDSERTTLFIDHSPAALEGSAPAGGRNLLGRYDMVCVRIHADFDRDWNAIKIDKKPCFWILHAAALNIGETKLAPDFQDFASNTGGLDEQRYLDSMAHIYQNVMRALEDLGVEQLVFFPFGMGAFLRHLHAIDAEYEDDMNVQRIRRQLASRFSEAFSGTKNITLHMCLQFSSAEGHRNSDAFLRAFLGCADPVKSRITVHPEGDSLHLSHELASKYPNVCMVNGANRQLIGNHWFGSRAQRAIDENLHRRSWVLCACAYKLNNFGGRGEEHGTVENRSSIELQQNVKKIGGRTLAFGGLVVQHNANPLAATREPAIGVRLVGKKRVAPKIKGFQEADACRTKANNTPRTPRSPRPDK